MFWSSYVWTGVFYAAFEIKEKGLVIRRITYSHSLNLVIRRNIWLSVLILYFANKHVNCCFCAKKMVFYRKTNMLKIGCPSVILIISDVRITVISNVDRMQLQLYIESWRVWVPTHEIYCL